MPNIKYVGTAVFMTNSRYAIPNIKDFDKIQSTLQLMNELAKCRKYDEDKGWFTLEDVEKNYLKPA